MAENRNGRHVTADDVCHYCLKPLTVLTRTKDHIVPRSIGGLDVRFNITMSCRPCNSDKASTFPTCKCAQCKRTIRRHWEMLKIQDPAKKKSDKM